LDLFSRVPKVDVTWYPTATVGRSVAMPHQIIEYSSNLESRLDIEDLVQGLHEAALQIPGLPLGGLRTRAARRDGYRIADQHPDNAFVHLILKLGHGRPLDRRREFGEALFAALCEILEPVSTTSPLAISFEIQEIHPELTWKKNNLRDYIAQRKGSP
jgi:5-carboxymethyl-2-hydroxymuconate isomerase